MQFRSRHPAHLLLTGLAWAWLGVALSSPLILHGQLPPIAQQSPPPSGRAVAGKDRNPLPESKTFYTRYRRFGLPITVLQAPYQIRSVQLHVSVDGGTTWRTYAEESANRSEFIFEAPHDGDYWFASKTVDVQNHIRPGGRTRPEQHVVIDTEKPDFDFRADVTAHGTVRIAWRVADRNLDPQSFLIEYQAPPRDDWTPIEIPSDRLQAEGGVMTGELEWKPTVSSRVVFLGSRVKDKAGNVAVESTRVFLPRVAARSGTNSPGNDERSNLENSNAPEGRDRQDVEALANGLENRSSMELRPDTYALRGTSPRATLPATGVPPGGESSSATVPWPATAAVPSARDPRGPDGRDRQSTSGQDNGSGRDFAGLPRPPESDGWTTGRSDSDSDSDADSDATAGLSSKGGIVEAEPPSGEESDSNTKSGSGEGPGRTVAGASGKRNGGEKELSETTSGVAGEVRPQVASRVPEPDSVDREEEARGRTGGAMDSPSDDSAVASGRESDNRSASHGSSDSGSDEALSNGGMDAWPEIPAGESLRMTRVRRFFLEYDIESAGPEGVAEVELWATQDGGRSWEKWGVDADKQSPLDVQVDEEGVYGFRVVVVGRNGLAAPAPQPGDPADLWVGVDLTPPKAEITAVTYGTGPRIGELDIRWVASDRRLTARPITLSFSASREGPWTTIASGIPNSGQYFWKIDGSVPKQVFLRIHCQDEAGNSTEFVIREPINTEQLSPKGRIRGFRPAEGEEPNSSARSAFFWFPWR